MRRRPTKIFLPWKLQNILEKYFGLIEDALRAYPFGGEPAELYEPIRYVLSLGGKRIRPVLTLMSCEMFDADYEKALFPALGIEVFHNFTLLHDDIMDKAPLRRGQATVHTKWNENIAILSGDVMLVRAYELFAKTNDKYLRTVLQKFNKCAAEVCEGQQYDMNYETEQRIAEEDYLEMIRLKTAVLLATAIEIGAVVGGADEATSSALYDFGINIGLGFQLKDDLLDVYGDSEKFGKRSGGDIIANKKTWLLIKALEKAEGAELRELNKWLDVREFDNKEKVSAVMKIYDNLGVKYLCEFKMNSYFSKAKTIFDSLDLPEEKKIPLRELTQKLMDRQR